MCSLARWQSLAVLVHNWSRHNPPPTHTHTVPNTLTTTAILLHLSILSSFTLSRKRRLSYEVFSDRRPKRHLNTEWVRERDREREREKDKEREGGRGRKRLTQIEFTRFSCADLKQIFSASAVQATGSEISPLRSGSRGSDSNWMSITHCDLPCSAMTGCLNHLLCRSEWRTTMRNVYSVCFNLH